MIHQRKKDYLQRIIDEFFEKLQKLVNRGASKDQIRAGLQDCFDFYAANFGISKSDSAADIISKVADITLIEQYARLLYTEYSVLDIKYLNKLKDALNLLEHLQRTDINYSWDRTILREDILRLIDRDGE